MVRKQKKCRNQVISVFLIIGVFVIFSQFNFPQITKSDTPPWLSSGKYAQYSTDGSSGLFLYNESLNPSNCTLLLQNTEFLDVRTIDADAGDMFRYRWEVSDLYGNEVVLTVHANVTGWLDSTFELRINLTDYSTSHNGTMIGYSRFWSFEEDYSPGELLCSNPLFAFGFNNQEPITTQTLQGIQETLFVDGLDPNGFPAIAYESWLIYDESIGLLVEAHADIILPFPLDSRFVSLFADLYLTATNIDLGPDLVLPDWTGLLWLSGIIGGVIVLTIVFYFARRRSRVRKVKRIKRRR